MHSVAAELASLHAAAEEWRQRATRAGSELEAFQCETIRHLILLRASFVAFADRTSPEPKASAGGWCRPTGTPRRHVAGERTLGGVQACARCGVLLYDPVELPTPGYPADGYPPGTRLYASRFGDTVELSAQPFQCFEECRVPR